MKCIITELYDTKSKFPYQAVMEVTDARPFEKLTGKVLNVPHLEGAGEHKILLGAVDCASLILLLGEKKIALRAYALSSGRELQIEEIKPVSALSGSHALESGGS